MMTLKGWVIIVIAIVAVFFLVGGIYEFSSTGLFTASSANQDVIKIGFIGPLTGPAASTGISAKQGFQLANEYFPTINGKKVEVIYEDDKADPTTALTAAKKLVEVNGAKIIVSAFSGPTLALVPYSNENGFLLTSPLAATPKLSNAGEYFFRLVPSSEAIASNTAEIVYQKGFKKTVILYELNDYPIGWKEAFKKKIQELGGEVVAEESFKSTDTDFRTQLGKLNQANHDALVIVTLSSVNAVKVLEEAREIGISKQIIGNETFAFKDVLALDTKITEGVLVSEYQYDASAPVTKQFLEKYRQRFADEGGSELYAALGYDTYTVLYFAIQHCIQNASYIKNFIINQGTTIGASGNYTMNSQGDAERKVVLKIIRNGIDVDYQ